MVHVIVILLDIFVLCVIVFDTYILAVCSLVNVWILWFKYLYFSKGDKRVNCTRES